MNEENRQEETTEPTRASGGPDEHQVDPAENPGPRGNQEVDPERLDRDEEDLDRTLPG